jgi:hypothetical protein
LGRVASRRSAAPSILVAFHQAVQKQPALAGFSLCFPREGRGLHHQNLIILAGSGALCAFYPEGSELRFSASKAANSILKS